MKTKEIKVEVEDSIEYDTGRGTCGADVSLSFTVYFRETVCSTPKGELKQWEITKTEFDSGWIWMINQYGGVFKEREYDDMTKEQLECWTEEAERKAMAEL